jgi:hypothetical protein
MADENKQTAKSTGDASSANPEAGGADLGDKDVAAPVSKPEAAKPNLTTKDEARTGPGKDDVSPKGIVFLALYLVVAILLCFYGLIALWPGPSPSRQVPPGKTAVVPTSTPAAAPPSHRMTQSSLATATPVSTLTLTPSATLSSDHLAQPSPAESASGATATPTPTPSAERSRIKIFGWHFWIWDEVRLLLIVILAGALGSLVHTVRSVYWYVGNRFLKWSWVPKYVLQPFAGSTLAVIFYVVVRGGFFSPQTTFENTSPFGFTALAALVGLFSEQAVLKLKKVAETVLEPPAPGEDAKPQQEVAKTVPSTSARSADAKGQVEVPKTVPPKSEPSTQAKPEEKGTSSSPDDTTKADTQ